jgi:hypothetical protein
MLVETFATPGSDLNCFSTARVHEAPHIIPETKKEADSIPSGTSKEADPPGPGAQPTAINSIIAATPLIKPVIRFIDSPPS